MIFRVQKVWIPDGYFDWSSVVEVEWLLCFTGSSNNELEERIIREYGPLETWCEHRRARSVITITQIK